MFSCLLALVLAMCSGQLMATDESEQNIRIWLVKMADATNHSNFVGTFVYHRGEQLIGMRIVHVSGPQGIRERLSSLNGAPHEVIRQCVDGVCRSSPGRQRVVISKQGLHRAFANDAEKKVDLLEQYYDFNVKTHDRIAGRQARLITIRPKDEYRYGYRLWLDEGNGLLLKSDLVDPIDHGILEQIMYTSIKFVDQPTEKMLQAVGMVESPDHGRNLPPSPVTKDMKASTPAHSQWKIGAMPAGFMQTEHYRHPKVKNGGTFEHMVISDGLANVSIFIEDPDEGDQPFVGFSQMGAVNAYGKVILKHQIIVVGEVPQSVVGLIGDSITRQGTTSKEALK